MDFESKLQAPNLSLDDICKILTLSTFTPTPPNAALIAQVNPDATYSIVGAFGPKQEFKSSRQHKSLQTQLPIPQAIRLNKAMWVSDRVELERNFPELTTIPNLPTGDTHICLPIRKMGMPIGSLTLIGDDLPLSEQGIFFLELLALLIASRLEPATSQQSPTADQPRHWLLGKKLTPREALIQSHMAQGKTNIEIASELEVSPSTIRQDAMNLFAKLGVNNRLDAGKLLGEG